MHLKAMGVVSYLLLHASGPLQLNMNSADTGAPIPVPVAGHLTAERPKETEADGGILGGAQVSSFGRKRKLRDMHDISACLCGKSAVPSIDNKSAGAVCCRVTGCETKWVSNLSLTQVKVN